MCARAAERRARCGLLGGRLSKSTVVANGSPKHARHRPQHGLKTLNPIDRCHVSLSVRHSVTRHNRMAQQRLTAKPLSGLLLLGTCAAAAAAAAKAAKAAGCCCCKAAAGQCGPAAAKAAIACQDGCCGDCGGCGGCCAESARWTGWLVSSVLPGCQPLDTLMGYGSGRRGEQGGKDVSTALFSASEIGHDGVVRGFYRRARASMSIRPRRS